MKKQGKVQLAVPVTAAEKATMAAMARREGKSLTAWAAGAIRAAWLRRDR
jgi:predicted HicB family RNase H-like nuclease